MNLSIVRSLAGFLAETVPMVAQLDRLAPEMAAQLYSRYRQASIFATANMDSIDPEFRVAICDIQDKVLERIVGGASFKDMGVRGVYTPATHLYRRWGNVELLKDKGLAGYTLAAELGARPVMMFGSKSAEYPYQEFLPGLEFLCSDAEPGEPGVYFEHLRREYPQMDVLVLHGLYGDTTDYLEAYRTLRPDGKVYCGLDLNHVWMGDIPWDSEYVKLFCKQCDVVATSCRSLRDALNRNPDVNVPCHWIPNGFLNVYQTDVVADAGVKENVILTVGRIGTSQKNTKELLVAFEKAHAKLPGWELRLVGQVEPEFKPVIDHYFRDYPHMRKRVTFTGALHNKADLFREYARAKVFALTSRYEGGTPNVYAEALVHGCMFVTSDIDAADDITNAGALGIKYRSRDIAGLANTLVKLCRSAEGEHLREHIKRAVEYAGKHYDWRRNAKKIAYMLYGGA